MDTASTLNTHWDRLTALATLGVNRQKVHGGDICPAPLNALAIVSEEATPVSNTQLLRIAAATSLILQAAQRRRADSNAMLEPAPTTDQPLANETSCWQLARLLTSDKRFLVAEWCALAKQYGQVVPAHWLPCVLTALQQDERPLFDALIGARGTWYLAQVGELRESTAAIDIDTPWQTGTLPERVAILGNLRASRSPTAQHLLASTWQTDPPDAKTAFLNVILKNPTLDDEPFLETALDDKRKGVRSVAAECLARLNASAHQQRMRSRLDGLLSLDSNGKTGLLGLKRANILEVKLPEKLDAAAQRDGIEAKPPSQRKIGERSYWLLQMLCAVDPAHWTARFACDPTALLRAMTQNEEAPLLIEGIATAACAHRNQEWLIALIEWWVDSASAEQKHLIALSTLIASIDSSKREAQVLRALKKIPKNELETRVQLLAATAGTWSVELSQTMVATLLSLIKSTMVQYAYSRDALQRFALAAECACVQPQLDALREAAGAAPWQAAIERFAEIIEARAAMRKAFTSQP